MPYVIRNILFRSHDETKINLVELKENIVLRRVIFVQ